MPEPYANRRPYPPRKRRATFDTSETRRSFGPVIIDYGKVQSKVSLKYDAIHKDVLSKFGSLLGGHMSKFHATVSKVGDDTVCDLMCDVVHGWGRKFTALVLSYWRDTLELKPK